MNAVKNFGEAVASLAIAAAAIGFIIKWASGWFLVDLSLEVELDRTRFDSDHDGLIISTLIRKGDRGALSLEKITVGLVELGRSPIQPLGAYLEPFDPPGLLEVDLAPTKVRQLRLTRGEQTRFTERRLVAKGLAVLVVVEVRGTSGAQRLLKAARLSKNRQAVWRSTVVTEPPISQD